jgi:hypothetical protein
MKNVLLLLGFLLVSPIVLAQETAGAKLDELTQAWHTEAESLSSYAGLTKFCTSAAYRNEIITTLKGIHHYDSMIYDMIAKKSKYGGGDAELTKTLKDIEKVQTEHSMKNFLAFLNEECMARNEIEKNAKKYGDDKDAEAYVIETELVKYVKHITKQIDVISDHVHHLNIK